MDCAGQEWRWKGHGLIELRFEVGAGMVAADRAHLGFNFLISPSVVPTTRVCSGARTHVCSGAQSKVMQLVRRC